MSSTIPATRRPFQLWRFRRGCDIVPFASPEAHDVGALAGKSASSDVVDVHLMIVAYQHGFGVVTGDEGDLRPIADALPTAVPIFRL